MARMRPEVSEHDRDRFRSRAEASFYAACRDQLDSQYLVIHSAAYIGVDSSGSPRDGEADFIIVDPRQGILVVEVKGGGIAHDPVKGSWSSFDSSGKKHDIKDPFRQATGAKHVVIDLIRSNPQFKKLGLGRIIVGHAVFFPDLDDLDGLKTPAGPRPIIGCKSDMKYLAEWTASVMSYWAGTDERAKPLGTAAAQIVEDIFCKPVEVRPLVSALLKEEEVARIRLTEQQARVLRVLGLRKKAAICGGAGTGKSLLAMQKAREMAQNGLATLLVCYNRPLADHLKMVAGDTPNLSTQSFHQLCSSMIDGVKGLSGRDLLAEARKSYPQDDLYDVQMPYALALAAEASDRRFDAVIVDEGQDFREEYWMPIELLLRHSTDSMLYIFYDQNQKLYQRASTFPIKDSPFPLTTNCRNTEAIHKAAYQFYKGELTDPPSIVGQPIHKIAAPTPSSQASRLHAEVTRLINEEKVRPEDIVVLVADSSHALPTLLNDRSLPGGAKWSFQHHRVPNTILIDTVKRFKGLESSIVFLWGVDDLSATAAQETLYVGISRAKSLLYVVGTTESCELVSA